MDADGRFHRDNTSKLLFMNHIDSPYHSMPAAMLNDANPPESWVSQAYFISGPISKGSNRSGDEMTILSSSQPTFLQQIFMFRQRKCHLQKVGDLHHLVWQSILGAHQADFTGFDVQVYNAAMIAEYRRVINLSHGCSILGSH